MLKKKTGGHAKSILILSATAGAGHVRAGDALAETARTLSLPVQIQHEDILSFTFPLFKKLYSETYYALVNASPELWGYLYKKTEKNTVRKKPSFLKLFDHFNYKTYLKRLQEIRPDAIICTHFLPYAAITDEIRKSTWRIPFFSVPTDYAVHALWIDPSIKRYYVATDEAAWTLSAQGIPNNNVVATGIPVMPQFRKALNKNVVRKKLGLRPNVFTIMVLSGGYGIGVIDKLVPSIANFLSTYGTNKQFQLLVVCGKNPTLYDKLRGMDFPNTVHVQLYQFISFVDALMNCSDVLITKSGGLTVSEALAEHLPMVIFDPIPGQEGRNADYVIEHGAGLSAINLPALHYKLQHLIDEPKQLDTMRKNAKQIARPDAAKKILEDVLQLV